MQANPDGQELALIAALAHEIGHIKWFQDDVDDINKTTNTCLDPVTNSYTMFTDITWDKHVAAPKWRYFGKETDGNKIYGGIDKEQLRKDLAKNDSTAVNTDLKTTYDGSWASIFSTVSPDEDYVETYTMIAVLQAMLQTSGAYLKIKGPNGQLTEMVHNYTNFTDSSHRDFNHKQQWVQNCAM
jgi:hypothetical protein